MFTSIDDIIHDRWYYYISNIVVNNDKNIFRAFLLLLIRYNLDIFNK